MKRTKTYDELICDFCKVEAAYHACKRCGKDVCPECGTEMRTMIYFTSGGDPHYCEECYKYLERQEIDTLFLALKRVTRLYNEKTAWQEEFEERRTIAEAAVKKAMGGS